MAKKTKKVAQSKVEQNADQILSRTDQFLDKYMKQLIIGISVVIILVLGFIGFRHFHLVPQEKKAADASFVAERYFGQQEWDLALNGDSIGNAGFLEVISDFGSTDAGNLAKAYAGMSFYHTGDYDSAVSYLKKYKQSEKVFGPAVTCLIGDCYVEMGDVKEAAKYFLKAAKEANNEVTSPTYLKKAAVAYENLENNKEALNIYNQIKNKYPNSSEAATIDKFIIRTQELLNK